MVMEAVQKKPAGGRNEASRRRGKVGGRRRAIGLGAYSPTVW